MLGRFLVPGFGLQQLLIIFSYFNSLDGYFYIFGAFSGRYVIDVVGPKVAAFLFLWLLYIISYLCLFAFFITPIAESIS